MPIDQQSRVEASEPFDLEMHSTTIVIGQCTVPLIIFKVLQILIILKQLSPDLQVLFSQEDHVIQYVVAQVPFCHFLFDSDQSTWFELDI